MRLSIGMESMMHAVIMQWDFYYIANHSSYEYSLAHGQLCSN